MSKNHPLSFAPLRILHTSDWHLGRRLYGRMRYEEFEAFLNWLTDTIIQYQVDVLIVAGDIFDTMTPSNRAQALYYEFLGKVSRLCCQHVVIVAGNHDSPSFLDAPSGILKFLNVHVIGTACDDLSDEVLVLSDHDGSPQCIIAAVPYLRERDVRSSIAGESGQDKDSNVIKGIRSHYDGVARIAMAEQKRLMASHHRNIPIIATGHLFAAGSSVTDPDLPKTTADDGVRDLYVGTLGLVSADMFSDCFDYVALGHLHVPQRVGGCEYIRYSGSPIAMGFGESRQQKQVLLIQFGKPTDPSEVSDSVPNADTDTVDTAQPVDLSAPSATPALVKRSTTSNRQSEFMDDLFGFDDLSKNEAQVSLDLTAKSDIDSVTDIKPPPQASASVAKAPDTTPAPQVLHCDHNSQLQITCLPIPCFQRLAQVTGDLDEIFATIKSLVTTHQDKPIWLEINYTGDEIVSNLRELIQDLVDDLPCEILKIKNTQTYNKVLNQQVSSESLQDLDELEVFDRCLDIHNIAASQRHGLKLAYKQVLYEIHHKDD